MFPQDKESLVKVSMVVTPQEEALQKANFEVTWTDEESGVAKKAKKVGPVFYSWVLELSAGLTGIFILLVCV